jgi:predicted PurR-regulated permease PerM
MNFETNKIDVPSGNDWASPSRMQIFILALATGFGIYLCYLLAAPFLPALTAALALAVLFTPFQRWLESKLKHPSLAAVVSVLVIGMSVAVPATFVGQRLAVQTVKGAELVQTKVKSGEWRRALEAQPRLAVLAEKIEQQIDLPGTVTTLATWLSTSAGTKFNGFDEGGHTWVGHDDEVRAEIQKLLVSRATS